LRFCVLALLLAGCAAPGAGFGPDALRTAEIAGIEDGPVRLVDGEWEGEPYVEDGAARPRIGLIGEFAVRGRFTGDDQEQCAVLAWHSTGGSGTRLWVVVLHDAAGYPRTASSFLVGDRVQVVDFRAEDGALVLDLVAHGEMDAACCPGQHELRRYRFVDGEFVAESEDLGRADPTMLSGVTWRLRSLTRAGAPVEVPVTLEFDGQGGVSGESGCNSFAGTVADSDGKNVAFEVHSTSARRCADAETEVEGAVREALASVERFSFLNGRLCLQYGGELMVFERAGE
jgi:heat shock protein HslJ